MQVTLVTDPEDLQTVLSEFKKLLQTHEFNAGHRYAEFKKGDKIAAYGLTALIAGGAAAVALKTGILQKFGKLIVFGAIAVVAAFGKFFKSIFGRRGAENVR